MDSILLRAILSMDAYNRGYDAGISGLSGTTIGGASVLTDSTVTPSTAGGQAVDFYAIAYQLADGSKVSWT